MTPKSTSHKTKNTPKTTPHKNDAPPKAQQSDTPPHADLLSMDEAIDILKTTRSTFYRWLRTGRISGMKAGRQWRFDRAEIERFMRGEEPRIGLRTDISPLLKALTTRSEDLGADPLDLKHDSDVARVVGEIIRLALALNASDIHLAPTVNERGEAAEALLRYRVDGVLHIVERFDARLLPPIIEQWKTLVACNPREKEKSQDGLMKFEHRGDPCDLRINFLPALLGETLTARLLPKGELLPLDDLGFVPPDLEKLRRAIEAPNGLIIVDGPAGSGKTMTLYACLRHLNRPELKIMTAEDPVEYAFPNLVQVQLNPEAGITYPRAIISMMRSDPDILMIGEIRDIETLKMALKCALTGHIVFSTLHAGGAVKALTRMVEMGSRPFIVGDGTSLVVSQRFVRALCPHCSQPDDPSIQLLSRAERIARAGGATLDALPKTFRRPVGCPQCGQLGFAGRTLLAEVLEMTPELADALRRGASSAELTTLAVGQGMTTLGAAGLLKAGQGLTTIDEVLRTLALG